MKLKFAGISAFLFVFAIAWAMPSVAQDSLFIAETNVPILTDRQDNALFYLKIKTQETKNLEEIRLDFGKSDIINDIVSLKLYYSGTEAHQTDKPSRFVPVDYMDRTSPLYSRRANPSYSVLKSQLTPRQPVVTLTAQQPLMKGTNYFWVSMQVKPNTSLDRKFSVRLVSAKADGHSLPIGMAETKDIIHRLGVGLRQAGDDGSAAFRIPGLATTTRGTLLAVYDVRYNNSVDLQEHVVIGLSRSTDGGQSWEKMRIPLDMTQHDKSGLPPAQNGVGDPCILVDEKTGTIFIAALWTHGMGNQRAWWSSKQGMEPEETGQLVLTKSTDDGKTWSAPINITSQVKKEDWYLLLQGPGKGITMKDGTLVFPIQYIAADRLPYAGVMYSKDHGETWTIHNGARSNTTEAQVVEVEPGSLMLNMRDNRGGSRAVAITTDLGKTWSEHSSSRKALIEPVCMASLIKIDAEKSPTGKDILLFSNPNHSKKRQDITIQASFDKGVSWTEARPLLLDNEPGWGYSCLTQIDKHTIGILYEGSTANLTFQRIKLADLLP